MSLHERQPTISEGRFASQRDYSITSKECTAERKKETNRVMVSRGEAGPAGVRILLQWCNILLTQRHLARFSWRSFAGGRGPLATGAAPVRGIFFAASQD